MRNQALTQHRVSARVYELAALRTGSVRDQLLRSTLVVHGLVDEALIDGGSKLLVFGAGAAGVNAAITAAELGVSVDVIERSASAFATFHLASWRRVDPVEYDWPQPHCRAGRFPVAAGTTALLQRAATGAALASAWAAEWQWWLSHRNGVGGCGSVDLIAGTDAAPFAQGVDDTGAGGVDVHGPWTGAGTSKRSYGAVLSCTGFGAECTRDEHVPDRWAGYAGPQFWVDDDGIAAGHAPLGVRHVVISGGGDGAMQDLQRVLAGSFGVELLDRLDAAAASQAATLLGDATLRALLLADDAARRAHAWQRPQQGAAAAHADWQRTFDAQAQAVVTALGAARARAIAAAVFRPELHAGRLAVTWLYRDATPGFAYPLNRWLCALLRALVGAVWPHAAPLSVHARSEVFAIRPPPGHMCGTPQTCRGVPHDVSIRHAGGGTTHLFGADLVVVRHGARPQPLLGGAPVAEQMVPFDIPR